MESQTTWLVLVLVLVIVFVVLISVGKASYLSLNSNNTMFLSCDNSSIWIDRYD